MEKKLRNTLVFSIISILKINFPWPNNDIFIIPFINKNVIVILENYLRIIFLSMS